ncbi:MAG TPA: hypothetical protein VFZ61_10465, partial [Polyangiales bacterium]
MVSGEAAGRRSSSHQEQLRARVSELIGAEELRALRALNTRYTFQDAATIYLMLGAIIGATALLHATIGPWTLLATPLLALCSGVAFNWINVQIHEASHNLLLPSKRANDLYCNVALGGLGLQEVVTYRATHGM